jgi:hypothetical protein
MPITTSIPSITIINSVGEKSSTGSIDACMVDDKAGQVSTKKILSPRYIRVIVVGFGIQTRLELLWRGLSLHRRGDQRTIWAWVI